MSSHPSPISELKLFVTQGSNTYEQVIPTSTSETTNSFQITDAGILAAFNSQPLGTIFTPSIVTTYAPGTFATGYVLSTPSTSVNFVPRQITPSFSVADIPEKTTIDEPFSVADLVTKTGTGVVSYSSSAQSVATINSSSGLVTIAGAGETDIIFSLAASADSVYKAATPITKTLTINLPPISRALNNVTIQYMGAAGDVPTSSPRFIEANPRGTGDEWFAVVKDGMNEAMHNYARGWDYTTFRPPGQSSPVPFNNIVTTHMTNMSNIFLGSTYNQSLNSWDTSKVINMYSMFNSSNFNQDISIWNVSNVQDMSYMFKNTYFTQNISIWNVSKVTNMTSMFSQAQFNQDISNITALSVNSASTVDTPMPAVVVSWATS